MKETKLMKATMMAMAIKQVAAALRHDAKDYDCHFPIAHAKRLEELADSYLKTK